MQNFIMIGVIIKGQGTKRAFCRHLARNPDAGTEIKGVF